MSKHVTALLVAVSFTALAIIIAIRSEVQPMPNKNYDDAIALMKAKSYNKAIEKLDAATLDGSDVIAVAGKRAECLYYLGNRDEDALKICDALIHVRNGRGWLIQGLILERQGKMDQAKEAYRLSSVAGDVVGMAQFQRFKKG